MATINPPYRFSPIENPVNIKWDDSDDADSDLPSVDCWFFFLSLFIAPDIFPTLRWPLCAPDHGTTTDPQTAVDSCEQFASPDGHVDHWFVDESGFIHCFTWSWVGGAHGGECADEPGEGDTPPTSPPEGWEGFDHSPNSEE